MEGSVSKGRQEVWRRRSSNQGGENGQAPLRRCAHEVFECLVQGQFCAVLGEHLLQDSMAETFAINEDAIAVED